MSSEDYIDYLNKKLYKCKVTSDSLGYIIDYYMDQNLKAQKSPSLVFLLFILGVKVFQKLINL